MNTAYNYYRWSDVLETTDPNKGRLFAFGAPKGGELKVRSVRTLLTKVLGKMGVYRDENQPIQSMPPVVRAFVENQPVTSIVESIRALLADQPVGNDLWIALVWCVGIMLLA